MTYPLSDLLTLGLLLVFAIIFLMLYVRLRRSASPPSLRPLPAVDVIRDLTERSIEEGREIHLALGSGRVTDHTSAETLMGLLVLDEIAVTAHRAHRPPLVSTADPASYLLAADILTQNEAAHGWEARTRARFIAPQPAAYGAGTRGTMQRENLGLTAAVGFLGDEYLFLAADQPDGGQTVYPPEIAATAHVETLPLVHLTARHPLLGEETFALGAYLTRSPAHLASVLLQDFGRVVVGVAVLGGVVGVSIATLLGWL